MKNIKAIIFDWGRTLYNSEAKKEFPDAEEVLKYCRAKGYRLAIASLVSIQADKTIEERVTQVESSPLRKYFELALVTNKDKDTIFDEIVKKINIPREQILIVDDRTIRGIRYGNINGHLTVWFRNGKFANELPDNLTGLPTYTINSLKDLTQII
jgi:FMN phosphatase YigB (HAD superfamily)